MVSLTSNDRVTADTSETERFHSEFDAFARASGRSQRFTMSWDDRIACLDDRTQGCGFDRHYVYHTAWAARVLAAIRPARHIDISSSLYFCSIVSAFLPVEYHEYRPVD